MHLPKLFVPYIFNPMKNTVGLIILIIICVALGVTLVMRNKKATVEKAQDVETILSHSNAWQETQAKLFQKEQDVRDLEDTLKARKEDINRLTNQLTETSTTPAKTEATLKATQEEVAKRDAKINELETQNQALDKQAAELSTSITNLNNQISETQRKLTASEGDKAFLQKELQRLMAEKAELERQFNDLEVLRAQVRFLKQELSIARRIEWIRQGLFPSGEQKGAQQLMHNLAAPLSKSKTNYNLNVEVTSDGSVKVIPPLTGTNAPTPPPPAPK